VIHLYVHTGQILESKAVRHCFPHMCFSPCMSVAASEMPAQAPPLPRLHIPPVDHSVQGGWLSYGSLTHVNRVYAVTQPTQACTTPHASHYDCCCCRTRAGKRGASGLPCVWSCSPSQQPDVQLGLPGGAPAAVVCVYVCECVCVCACTCVCVCMCGLLMLALSAA